MTRRRLPLPSEVLVDAPGCGELPPWWWVWDDPKTAARYDSYILRRGSRAVQNAEEISTAELDFMYRARTQHTNVLPLPPEVPPPRLALPARLFAPDFFYSGSFIFVSRLLREVLALPPEVVEYTPAEVVDPVEAVQAKDYQRMRVLPEEAGALDPERSGCEIKEYPSPINGQMVRRFGWPDPIVLHPGFRPRTPLFRLAESPTIVLATDELAQRVMAAGCTGIHFEDFGVSRRGMHVARRRTATGVALLRVGYLD